MLEIRELTTADLDAVAAVHLAAFPSSALTSLGREAVRRYYEWQMIGPHDIAAIGAFEKDNLLGFCFGGIFRGALSGFLDKNRAFLAYRVLIHPWLIANPLFRDRLSTATHILKHFSRRKTAPVRSAEPAMARSYGILAIAVNPCRQGSGVGKLLMTHSEAIAQRRCFAQMHLTVSLENTQAISFYERLGWQRIPQGDIWTGRMHKHLTENTCPTAS